MRSMFYGLTAAVVIAVCCTPLSAAEPEERKQAGPALAKLQTGDVVAKVGDKVILYEEIAPTVNLIVNPVLAKAKLPAERQMIEAQRELLTKNVIQQAVQAKMLLIEFERGMPSDLRADAEKRAQAEKKLWDNVRAAFDATLRSFREKVAEASQEQIDKLQRQDPLVTRLALLMKERHLESQEELDAALRQLGTSLDQQVKAYGEYMVGIEAARSALKKKKRAVTPDETLKYYEQHLADYYIPAKARFEILTAKLARFEGNRAAAREFAASMADEVMVAKKPFADVARRMSQEPRAEEGGAYDWTTTGSLASIPIDRAVFSLEVGKLSQMIEDDLGCHVVRVIERREGRQMSFNEAEGAIQTTLEERNRKDDQKAYLDGLRSQTKVWTIYDNE